MGQEFVCPFLRDSRTPETAVLSVKLNGVWSAALRLTLFSSENGSLFWKYQSLEEEEEQEEPLLRQVP